MSELIKLSRHVFWEKAQVSSVSFRKFTSVIVAIWIRDSLKTLLGDSSSLTSLTLWLMKRSIDAILKSFTNSNIKMESVFKMLSNATTVWSRKERRSFTHFKVLSTVLQTFCHAHVCLACCACNRKTMLHNHKVYIFY